LVEEVPDVIARSVDPMWMQALERRIIAVSVEGSLGFPLDENQHRPGFDASCSGLAKLAEGDQTAAVRLNFLRRPTGIRQVRFLVRDVEEIECVDGPFHEHLRALSNVPNQRESCRENRAGADSRRTREV